MSIVTKGIHRNCTVSRVTISDVVLYYKFLLDKYPEEEWSIELFKEGFSHWATLSDNTLSGYFFNDPKSLRNQFKNET
jgi:hypothetical protein